MRVKLNDVADRITGNVDRFNTDLEYYVGGEHYDSGCIAIYNKGILRSEKGSILGFKFHFPFQTGDTLFMARNPHLKKAGMVTYDGITSDASYVLRTKDESVLLPEYLPLVIQNDLFWAFFEANKSGSVNYLMNWKEMKNYEFDLPPIEEQQRIAALVWAINDTKKAYRTLIDKTNALVNRQFEEKLKCCDYVLAKLSDECKLITKGTTPTTIGYDFVQEGVNFVKIENIQTDGSIDKTGMMCINQECNAAMKRSQLQVGDILFSIAGAIGRSAKVTESILPANINQALAIIRLKEDSSINNDYLYAVLQSGYIEEQYINLKRGVAQLNLSLKDVGNFMIPIPSVEEQEEFVSFYKQAECSKTELHSAIEALIGLERSVFVENFN